MLGICEREREARETDQQCSSWILTGVLPPSSLLGSFQSVGYFSFVFYIFFTDI